MDILEVDQGKQVVVQAIVDVVTRSQLVDQPPKTGFVTDKGRHSLAVDSKE